MWGSDAFDVDLHMCEHIMEHPTRFEPSWWCENLAIEGEEYCSQHINQHDNLSEGMD